MISVLIPVYNADVLALVSELHRQLEASGVLYEILCYDDGSNAEFRETNRIIAGIKNVRYLEMGKNLGRAKIRNRMAGDARYDYLLFADCDSAVVSPDFIRKYLEHIDPSAVIFGGRCYRPDPPADKKKMLHWQYGMNRESLPAGERTKEPYRCILTNNFLVPKSIFLSSGLNEEVTGYGYEDSAFGFDLMKRKITVKHIDNPLLHTGLEDSDVFLEKTGNALKNLSLLMKRGNISREVKIVRWYRRIDLFPVNIIISAALSVASRFIRRNLLSENPSLFLFDLYRLGLLLHRTSS